MAPRSISVIHVKKRTAFSLELVQKYDQTPVHYLGGEDVFVEGVVPHVRVVHVLQNPSHLVGFQKVNAERGSLYQSEPSRVS